MGNFGSSIDALSAFVQRHRKLFVLTGAGVSTDSGIPGYRDADGRWTRSAPIQFNAFLHSESARRRYWARSLVGWPVLAAAAPNLAHRALARLEAMGRVRRLVTQNVDGLHQRAGSVEVVELHGDAHRAVCLACGAVHPRAPIQRWLVEHNPAFANSQAARSAADGDAEIEANEDASFRIPACARCGGMLKPDVVFFGECVPRERVDAARRALAASDAMLVVGSSLTVYSGYRFCEWAIAAHTPLACINVGRTRADSLLALKVEYACGETLAALVDRLSDEPHAPMPLSTEESGR